MFATMTTTIEPDELSGFEMMSCKRRVWIEIVDARGRGSSAARGSLRVRAHLTSTVGAEHRGEGCGLHGVAGWARGTFGGVSGMHAVVPAGQLDDRPPAERWGARGPARAV